MIDMTINEITCLVNAKKTGYSEIPRDDNMVNLQHDNGNININIKSRQYHASELVLSSHHWKTVGCVVITIALLAGFFAGTSLHSSIMSQSKSSQRNNFRNHSLQNSNSHNNSHIISTCRFCDDQSPPKLHYEKSYTVQIQNSPYNNNDDEQTQTQTAAVATVTATVIPMTVSYDYELQDGENLYTMARSERIPNLDFDYAVLGVRSARNRNRDTGDDVSLDEVYLHHFTLQPINMIGAEVLNRKNDDPYMRFPEGYALHVMVDSDPDKQQQQQQQQQQQLPHLGVNAHLLSNKNLAPIHGSLERARKECNECYYSPTKGSDCTPEGSGTFLCCGDSHSCTQVGGEDCGCATTTADTATTTGSSSSTKTTTKYRIELDLLVSREVHKFQRVDQWNFAAPACSINIHGDAVVEEYPPDNFCAKKKQQLTTTTNSNSTTTIHGSSSSIHGLAFGGGSAFHQVPENNDEPYLRTTVHVLAPSGGKMVWAQSHLHTGGINATLYKNGKSICTTRAEYGTNAGTTDVSSNNARDEQNHLVRISSCYDQIRDGGIIFDTGDVFTTESYYYAGMDDDRFEPRLVAAGEHKNVMSMFFTGVVLNGNSKFLTEERTSFNLWNDFVHVAGLY